MARGGARVTAISVGVVVGAFAVMAWRWRWTHDDGFITFRVVDQIFAGNGPVYNEGERVEAFTSPLHLGLLVVLRALLGWGIDQAWLSLLLTLGAAVGGLVAAADGARSLARAGGARGTLVPFALIVPAVLPPMWEYATAGLETGLAIGWVGASFAALARLAARQRDGSVVGARRAMAVAVLVGLGPLVRPEGALLSLAFVAVLCTTAAVREVPRWRLVAAALALPLAYQVLRMGYYASIVPNTALAKAAGESRWDQGWYYLVNTVGPYALVVPLLAMAVWVVAVRRRRFDRMFGGSDGLRLVVATVAAALVHVLYVVRVGGDYMHARMLLVPLFALCCPLAVVPLPRSRTASGLAIGTVTVVAGWGLLVLVALRPPAPGGLFDEASIAEQRPFYVTVSGAEHPVTLDDWRRSSTYELGDDARRSAAAGEDVLFTSVGSGDVDWPYRSPTEPGSGVSAFVDGIGVVGARAGVDVHLIDLHGLAHPLASRMPIQRPRVLPGHERVLPLPWALAEARVLDDDPTSDAAIARLARACPPASDVLDAIRGPVGEGGFASNLLDALRLSRLEIPSDPAEAVAGCDDLPSGTVVGGS